MISYTCNDATYTLATEYRDARFCPRWIESGGTPLRVSFLATTYSRYNLLGVHKLYVTPLFTLYRNPTVW